MTLAGTHLESQLQAGQICPLMNLLSDTGLDLGNLNLQEECDFQAAELAGLAKVFLSLSSSSSENWSHQFCDYLATMISEVCYIPYHTVCISRKIHRSIEYQFTTCS